MTGFLERMATSSALRATQARARNVDRALQERAHHASAPRVLQLDDRFDLIAEIKLRSPAEGVLGSATEGWEQDLMNRARAYVEGGAVALSVLTEPAEFGGSLQHLEVVAAAVDVPVMRKDFVVDEVQVLEARASGASGVLLIARIVPVARLGELLDLSLDLGMFVLLEAFDREDLKKIGDLVSGRRLSAGPRVLVGVNSRNLSTLKVDTERLHALAPALPEHVPAVAESGMLSAEDVATVARDGYRLALVGSALMRTDDPARTINSMLMSGRAEGT